MNARLLADHTQKTGRNCLPIQSILKLMSPKNTRTFSGVTENVEIEDVYGKVPRRGVLLEHIPLDFLQENILRKCFRKLGVMVPKNHILFQKSRFGKLTGRSIILTDKWEGCYPLSQLPEAISENSMSNLKSSHLSGLGLAASKKWWNVFPEETRIFYLDEHDLRRQIEQFERYFNLAVDISFLAQADFFLRVITLVGVPESYGRRDVQHLIKRHCGVDVMLPKIIFRFRRDGRQADSAFVCCEKDSDVKKILNSLQEIPVPRKVQHGNIFGANFVWANRSNLFAREENPKFSSFFSKFQVCTTGWDGDVTEEEILSLFNSLMIFPKNVRRLFSGDKSSTYLLEFYRMKDVKLVMSRLNDLKHRWRISPEETFFAYPKLADMSFETSSSILHYDMSQESDIDEPIDY